MRWNSIAFTVAGCGVRVGRRLLAVLLSVQLMAGVAAGADLRQLERRAEELIEELRRERDAVRREREALQAEREALERERKAREAAAAAAPPAAAPAETERKVDILAEEIERVKSSIALPEGKELKSYYGLGPAASKVYQVSRGLSLGGYGEGQLSLVVADAEGTPNRADALRFVLYTGYKFSDRILLNTELEFEHATTDETVSASAGEVSLEFAYLDFLGWEQLNARAGLVLQPLGFINEIHEPVYFYGNFRPELARRIIPTTWRSLGAGVFGRLHEDLQYRGYVTTGLNAAGFSDSGIRDGRQKGNRELAESVAGSMRLDYTPHQIPGSLIGASAYLGGSGQDQTFAGEKAGGFVTLWDLHAQYAYRGFWFRSVAAFGSIGDAAAISREVGSTVPDRFNGYYLETAYDVMPHLFPTAVRQSLAPFFRFEHIDTQAGVPAGFARNPEKDFDLYTVGLSYKPHPQVVLKLDYRNFVPAGGTIPDDVNVGLGFVF
jgi:hypothetical protein